MAIITIESDHLVCEVNALGAETHSLRGRDGQEWLWNGDPAYWSGRSPILFPIVGRAHDDIVAIGDTHIPMTIHGFAKTSEFSLVEQSPSSCRHRLSGHSDWPFEFQLDIIHALADRTLTVRAEVTNLDDTTMPFCFGFHPAFVQPLPSATGVHAITLDPPAEPPLSRLKGGALNPDTLPSPFQQGRLDLNDRDFEADAMIFRDIGVDALCYHGDSGPKLRFAFENLPDLGIWKKPGTPYICIEPWHGTDAIYGSSRQMTDRPNAVSLPAGQTWSAAHSVTII